MVTFLAATSPSTTATPTLTSSSGPAPGERTVHYVTGAFDEFVIWERALSPQDIRLYYNAAIGQAIVSSTTPRVSKEVTSTTPTVRATEVSPPVVIGQHEEVQNSQDPPSMPVLGFLKALPNRTIPHNTANNLTQAFLKSVEEVLSSPGLPEQSTPVVSGLIETVDRVMEHMVTNLEPSPSPNSLISLGGTSFVADYSLMKFPQNYNLSHYRFPTLGKNYISCARRGFHHAVQRGPGPDQGPLKGRTEPLRASSSFIVYLAVLLWMIAQTTIVGLFYHNMHNYYKEISPVKTRINEAADFKDHKIQVASCLISLKVEPSPALSINLSGAPLIKIVLTHVLTKEQQEQVLNQSNKVFLYCAFLDYSSNEGVWSNEGCVRSDGNMTYSVCLCNHLTNFAILMQVVPLKHSDGEMHRLQPKARYSPTQDAPVFLLKEIANQDSRNTSSYTEEYVMVPAQFPSEYTCELDVGSPIESCLIYSGCSPLAEQGLGAAGKTPPPSPPLHSPSKLASKPAELVSRTCSQAVPIPVPTQIQNYQRMEQNLQPVGLHGSTRATLCAGSSESSPHCGGCRAPGPGFLATGGARPQQSSPQVGMTPKTSEQTLPLSSRTGLFTNSPDMAETSTLKQVKSRKPTRARTVLDLQSLDPSPASQTDLSSNSANHKGPFKRSLSTGRLSDMLLKAAFGAHLFEVGSDESLNCEKSMDITAPPTGCHRGFPYPDSPPPAVFTMGSPAKGDAPQVFSGSPSYMNSAWLLNSRLLHGGSRRKQRD
ncbi:Adhesion G-protein coupled receptor D1 [Larimichthys crocea]|uniref:Uncharacterized protein n=1 Tax=Larimichthys crocea TaxID=215358 RepID=A0ACD3Q9N5_LARCR|nr:Adhesion G-protein coupled receptor D1 [Larimichthys crocea]